MRRWMLLAVGLLLSLTGCDKLEDSDVIGEVLPGRWEFTYTTSEVVDYELSYRYVEFRTDATCVLAYSGGLLEGTFRAGDAAIRIDVADEQGKVRTFLWKVLTLSPNQIVTEYRHQQGDNREVTFTVTLIRL